MIAGIHHVQITIPRDAEDAAKLFYCGILGLSEIPKPASLQARGGFWMAVGNQAVHVGVEDGVNRDLTKAHVAYRVTDLKQWRANLDQHGIKVIDGIPIPGFDRFEFRDPFGNRVELLQPESE